MSFGSVFASIGTKMGMDPVTASILGGGYDAVSDYSAQAKDRAQLQDIFRQQGADLKFKQNLALRRDADQRALRDRLLTQSANLSEAIKQVNQYLGVPYTPSKEDIMRDMFDFSNAYRTDIFKLAELTASKAQAANLAKLGGADSTTLENKVQADVIAKYAPELQKADMQAKVNALKFASERMNLDQASRAAFMKQFTQPYEAQFGMEKSLYSPTQTAYTGSGTTLSSMFDTAMKSTSASNTSFSRTLDNLAKTITGPNNTNKTADSTIVGSGTIADDRPSTDMYGNPIIYLPDGTEQRTT
tara:strand:+ start:21460 stop:22362 length:903 start_codon:yes stop_codon:yes gene_type:complete